MCGNIWLKDGSERGAILSIFVGSQWRKPGLNLCPPSAATPCQPKNQVVDTMYIMLNSLAVRLRAKLLKRRSLQFV